MDPQLAKRLQALDQPQHHGLLRHIRRGIEKESLRITDDGRLSRRNHPEALGSALTHPHITTDYSEALLEFITAPDTELNNTLAELEDIHRFTYRAIGDEILWASSMPCILESNDDIPIAQYGSSNVGRMKHVYRVGLGHRYGRLMQTIAGIHYNFSLDDDFWEWLQAECADDTDLQTFKTSQYFALIRNFHRYSWLLVYLFGASPAVCSCFVNDNDDHGLEPFTRGTLYAPYATCLRMGDLGYQSNAQAGIDIPYNTLEDYVDALHQAIVTPHPDYERIGVKSDEGWLQLSSSLLQIENEFYTTIRPKRVAQSGESPRHALSNRGVEYIEVRCLDIDPFEPTGIAPMTARFLDTFLILCLLRESPLSDTDARQRSRENLHRAVMRGREPGLQLLGADGQPESLQASARSLLTQMESICQILDASRGGTDYQDSLQLQRRKVDDPEQTPSARVIRELEQRDIAYFRLAMDYSLRHRAELLAHPPTESAQRMLSQQSRESLQRQAQIEQSDSLSFEDYIAAYFAQ